MKNKQFQLPEELNNMLTNLPTTFYYVSYLSDDEDRIKINLTTAKYNLHLVESEIKKVLNFHPRFQEIFFDYLSYNVNQLIVQIKKEVLPFQKEREEILGRISKMVYEIFKKSIKVNQNIHFSRQFTKIEQQKLFDGLIKEGFLPERTNYNHFCYIFGGTPMPENETQLDCLEWQKSQALLTYFIYKMFIGVVNNLWTITRQCFILAQTNNNPNINTMKKDASQWGENSLAYKEPPKGYEILERIII